jgi:GTP pyrophosphokinase
MEINAKLLEKAIVFATEKHKGVVRKGNGLPYITHPIAVMGILNTIKKSNNAFLIGIVALLHDVAEDCDVTIEEIATEFGHKVASLVDELTSDPEKIKEIGKKEYLLDKMLNMSSYGLRIKLADRLHNVSDIDSMKDADRDRTIEHTLFILDGLTERKLTKTHKKLIKLIRKEISRFKK